MISQFRSRSSRLRESATTSWAERLAVATPFIATCALAFVYVDKLNAKLDATGRHFYDISLAIDDQIPLVPAFVFAYVLYYAWLLLPLALRERARFYHAVAAFAVLQVSAILMFVLVPTQMARPAVVGGGLSRDLVRWLYRADQGCNLVPSLHVAHSALVALLFWHARSRWLPWVLGGTLLISLSTVLIKQHYVADIPAGLLFSVAAFYAALPVFRHLDERHHAYYPRGNTEADAFPAWARVGLKDRR